MSSKEPISIRMANIDDADAIVEFIDQHWYIENHVFVRERSVFNDQHLVDGQLNFILGVGEDTGQIYGICGFLRSNRTDSPEIFPAIYQTIKSSNSMLGIDLIRELKERTGARCMASSGIRLETKIIYDFLGYKTDKLRHFYRLGDKDSFRIAVVENRPVLADGANGGLLVLFGNMDELKESFSFDGNVGDMPRKDEGFIERRYFTNVGYEYKAYGVFAEGGDCRAVLFGREVCHEGSIAFKIVDFIGDDEALACCSAAFGELIDRCGYEFVDIYEYGLSDEALRGAGFVERLEDDPNVIPHFFEPFDRRNIDIYFYATDERCRVFRADGGQDRPNYI